MNMHWFFAWWNLVFILPLGLALIYLLVMATTGLGIGEADIDADADVDAHVEVDTDAHVEADAAVHVDADADTDGDTDSEASAHEMAPAGGGSHAAPLHVMALGVLGLGKVPLSIIMLTLVITWSITGLVINAALAALLTQDWMGAFVSIPIAAVVSIAATGGIAAFIQRWFPMSQTFVTTRREMLGKVGQAIFNIDHHSGVAQVRDPHGDLFQIDCRVADDAAIIPKGQSVLLVDYDEERNCFYAKPYEPPETPGASRVSGTAQPPKTPQSPRPPETPETPKTPATPRTPVAN